jgi:putative peptide zinc metalloprotease protein
VPAAKGIGCKRCHRPVDPVADSRGRFVHCRSCGYTFRAGAAAPCGELELRSDLVIAPVEEDGASYFVIKDPGSNRYFRIKPLEHFLITQFDGKTSLETIRRRASEEKDVLVSEEVLSRFAGKFHDLGLLRREGGDAAPVERAPSSGIFHWKLPLANPDALVDRLYPAFRWCFSPSFVGLAGLTLLVASAVFLLNAEELVLGLESVVSLEGLFFVLVTVSVVTVLHEMAHALACRHFGGRVTDMGFLLLYFLPCFYCNVGDTYLFRGKRERLWVFFAGGFFELFLWALSVLGWRLVAPGTLVSSAFFVVAAVSGIRSLFNFNPLIQMDGYFMLSEHLGIKNLRRQALSGLGNVLRRASGLTIEPAAPEILERRIFGLRGDRFLTVFGAAALVYTALLVGGLAFYSGGYVFENLGADALALYAVTLVGLLHKPALTAVSAAKEAGKEKWQNLGERKKRSRFVFVWVAIALVALFFPWELRIRSDLSVLPLEREIVRAPSSGRIGIIHVNEGDRVEKGGLILEYDATELELSRRNKAAELEEARQQLPILGKESPAVREEIRVAERALETARQLETRAQQDFERDQQSWTNGIIPQQTFDHSENALEEARSRSREAEAELELARKLSPRSRAEEIERTHLKNEKGQQARIEMLEAELAALDDQLERTKIYASVSGTLTTYRFEEKVGDYLEEGAEVCEIANYDRVVLEMPVSEKDMDVVDLEKPVKFKVRGYPFRSFHAQVDEIAPIATPNGKSSTVLVRAYVDNTEKLLKPGMTGVAKIYCGMSFVGNIFTRDLVRFIRTEFWL